MYKFYQYRVLGAIISSIAALSCNTTPPKESPDIRDGMKEEPGQAMSAQAKSISAPKYKANVPASILTPDVVETRLGTLRFSDGIPEEETSKLVYDNLDFMRGVQAYLDGQPANSIAGLCKGFKDAGIDEQSVGIFEQLADARSLFLTANSSTVYVTRCYDLKEGPLVLEVPKKVLGPLDDAYFRHVVDMGITGPDKGAGGKYLLLPPNYKGELPKEGYFLVHSPTYMNWQLTRAFIGNDGIEATVRRLKETMRVYPWAQRDNPPETKFVNLSGVKMNTISPNNFEFFELLNKVIQHEPGNAFPPEFVGTLAAIGIKKGKSFSPDERMRKILKDAAAVGNATARAIAFAPQNSNGRYFKDRQWKTAFIGGNSEFYNNGERLLNARSLFHFYAIGITPAMASPKVGTGSVYAYTEDDENGKKLDGSKTYKLTLPSPIPAKDFWSFVVYDNQTRSILETDQRLAGLDSKSKNITINEDGSITVWFGPKAPLGKEGNWVQTWPGKGWNTIFRLYGPLESWFDKTWKPGDFKLVK